MSDKAGTRTNNKERNNATLSKISNAIRGSEKLDVEGTDLLELLSHLEGELQARDIAIAALKSEQLKRVLYGLHATSNYPIRSLPLAAAANALDVVSTANGGEGGNSQSDSLQKQHPPFQVRCPLTALHRDKLHTGDANYVDESVQLSASSAETEIAALHEVIDKQRYAAGQIADCLRQSESQRLKALEDLDNERQKHRQVVLAAGVAAASGGLSSDDITATATINYELEQERNRYKEDYEKELLEKQKLEAALKDINATLEEEKSKQKQIVLILLSDRKKLHKLYREEKKRSEDLAQMLQDEKGKMDTMAMGLEEESKRSLAMEAELEKHLCQFGSERQQLREKLLTDERKFRDMEEALRKARLDVEHFKKQLAEAHRVAMSQASPPLTYPGGMPGAGGLLAATAAITTNSVPSLPVSPTPLSVMNRQHPVSASQNPYPNAAYSTYSVGMVVTNSSSLVNSMSMVGSVGVSGVGYGHHSHTLSGGSAGYNHPPGQGYNTTVGGGTIPRTAVTGSVITSRATQGNPIVRSVPGAGHPSNSNIPADRPGENSLGSGGGGGTANQSKYHQQNYSNSGVYSQVSHPAMMPTTGPLSHLDQDLIPSDIYSQIVKPALSNNMGGSKQVSSSVSNTIIRKQAESGANPPLTATGGSAGGGLVAANRKPGLGKGVPPPVPPNKPAVGPAKKDPVTGGVGGKRDAKETLGLTLEAGKQSMVTGLQGLKFGISIGGGGGGSNDGGKLKADGSGQGGGGPLGTKKFFSNIESKS